MPEFIWVLVLAGTTESISMLENLRALLKAILKDLEAQYSDVFGSGLSI